MFARGSASQLAANAGDSGDCAKKLAVLIGWFGEQLLTFSRHPVKISECPTYPRYDRGFFSSGI